MELVDLTLPIQEDHGGDGRLPPEVFGKYAGKKTVFPEQRVHKRKYVEAVSVTYGFEHLAIMGTYIDFPGHILRTDDGMHAENYRLEGLYRVDATVIHLDKADGSGGVSAEELREACPGPVSDGALVVNALGKRRFDEIERGTVYLEQDTVGWIVDTGVHLLVSDVYEAAEPRGVFLDLFGNGISAVCCFINLDLLTAPRVKLTVPMPRYPGVTQVPCRVVAEAERAPVG